MHTVGPECVAQQKKLVATSTMNCGEVTAPRTVMALSGASIMAGPAASGWFGGRRSNNAAGSVSTATTPDRITSTMRQS